MSIYRVYFVRADSPERLVKIGVSRVERHMARLQELQIGCPVPLMVVATIDGPITLEDKLHKRFQTYRRHGEWFYFSSAIARYIDNIGSRGGMHFPNRPTLAEYEPVPIPAGAIKQKREKPFAQIRQDRRLTVAEAAHLLQLNPVYLRSLELGHSPLSYDLALEMAKVYECSLPDLRMRKSAAQLIDGVAPHVPDR